MSPSRKPSLKSFGESLWGKLLAGEIALNRPWQEKIFYLLVLVAVPLSVLSICTLHSSPVLSLDSGLPFPIIGSYIEKIDHLRPAPALLKTLPEFGAPGEERNWWLMQERLYGLLKEKICPGQGCDPGDP